MSPHRTTGERSSPRVSRSHRATFCQGLLPHYPKEGGVILHQVSYSFDVSGCAVYAGLCRGMTLFTVDHQMGFSYGDGKTVPAHLLCNFGGGNQNGSLGRAVGIRGKPPKTSQRPAGGGDPRPGPRGDRTVSGGLSAPSGVRRPHPAETGHRPEKRGGGLSASRRFSSTSTARKVI